MDIQSLKKWFLQNKRKLPWRLNPTPYTVWISEVMLQQTQALRVVDYFERFLDRFPTVYSLSQASEQELFKLWEGLGYYSRARSLLKGAQYIVEHHDGVLPSTEEALQKIPGLGPYTVGAVRSFGFQQKAAAVDANVIRVITRLFAIEEDITSQKTQQKIRDKTLSILPDEDSFVVMEALIELGATICSKRSPRCMACPLHNQCQAVKQGIEESLPVSSKKTKYEQLFRDVVIITCDEHMLLQKVKEGKIMAGLYEFPYFSTKKGGGDKKEIITLLDKEYGLDAVFITSYKMVKQSFTRFRVELYPHHLAVATKKEAPGYEWHPLEAKEKLAFSSGHKKILNCLAEIQPERISKIKTG